MKCWTGWNRDHRKVYRRLRRRTPAEMRQMLAKGAGRYCPRKLSEWKRCTRQRSLAGSSWQDHQMLPICQATFIAGYADECVRAHTWAPLSVAAFPGPSSLCPWPALASGDTWVARAGFPRKSIEWGWAGASEGENSKGSSFSTWSWASVCRELDHWRSWCHWPSVASFIERVLLGRRNEDGKQLWARWETVGAVFANSRANDTRSSLDTIRSFGRFRRFPEPLRLIPDSHCCFAFSLLS